MFDRNNSGNWGSPPYPFFLDSSGDTDFATFSNQVRATEYCDRSGANCFVPNGPGGPGGPGGSDGSDGSDGTGGAGGMVNQIWGNPPSGISAWPDWFFCTINGNRIPFTMTNGRPVYRDQQNADGRSISFSPSGQNDNATKANDWGTCGSIQQICQAGNCGFFGSGAPSVTSVPPTLPPPPPFCDARCQCQRVGGTWQRAGDDSGCFFDNVDIPDRR